MAKGSIRVGIGGWTFAPWEGSFYPSDLPKKQQLEYASSLLRTIEINGTYYRGQTPETFAKWASQTPDGFVFSVKASRFVTNRKMLAEAAPSIEKFFATGVGRLQEKLGPIVWQLPPTKRFDQTDLNAFFELLPTTCDGIRLRHVLEVRHESFAVPEFIEVARKHNIAICYAHHASYPEIADVTSDFVYARLQRGDDAVPTAYSEDLLDEWAARCRDWCSGGCPDDLPLVCPDQQAEKLPRDVFVYIIHEGKVRAPQGALSLQKRVD